MAGIVSRSVSRVTNFELCLTVLLYAPRIAIYNNISKLIDVVIYRQHVSIYIVASFMSHIRVQI